MSQEFWISLVEGMDRNADMSISYHEFMSYLSGRKKLAADCLWGVALPKE